MKIISKNRKAYHDYTIAETIEVGVVLMGDEVKSLRAGLVNLTGSFATVTGGELYLLNCYIGPYSHAYTKSDEHSRRTRKLLVHRRELTKLVVALSRKGMTLVPLQIYFNEKSRIKIEVGVARHKSAPDRREELRERDIKRETRRELKNME